MDHPLVDPFTATGPPTNALSQPLLTTPHTASMSAERCTGGMVPLEFSHGQDCLGPTLHPMVPTNPAHICKQLTSVIPSSCRCSSNR